jgi:hypothetical protein
MHDGSAHAPRSQAFCTGSTCMAPRPLIHIIMQPVDPLAARLTHPLDPASSLSPLVHVLSRNSCIVPLCLSSLQPMSGGAAKRGPTTAVPEEVGMSSARLDQLERFQREMVDGERLPCTHLVVTRHGRTVYVFTLAPTMTTSALPWLLSSCRSPHSATRCTLHATREHTHSIPICSSHTLHARTHKRTMSPLTHVYVGW